MRPPRGADGAAVGGALELRAPLPLLVVAATVVACRPARAAPRAADADGAPLPGDVGLAERSAVAPACASNDLGAVMEDD